MQNIKLGVSFINVPHLREIQYINYPRNRWVRAGCDEDIWLLILNNNSSELL